MSHIRARVNAKLSSIVLDALREAGLPYSFTDSNAMVNWVEPSYNFLNKSLASRSLYAVTNQITGIGILYSGSVFSRLYQKFSRILPDIYDYLPPTYVLPYQNMDFMKKIKKNGRDKFIYRSDPKNNEPGQILFNPPDYIIMSDDSAIGQKKINSISIDCQEIKISAFVLIASVSPLAIFVYRDGIVHYCNTNEELYNDTIDKNSRFQPLSELFERIENEYSIKEAKLWDNLHRIVVSSILLCYPYFKPYNTESYPYSHNFQLLQFDFLMDTNWKFYLNKIEPVISSSHINIQEYLLKVKFVRDGILAALPIPEIQHIFDSRRNWWKKTDAKTTGTTDISYGETIWLEFIQNNPQIENYQAQFLKSDKKYANFKLAYPSNKNKEKYSNILQTIASVPLEIIKK
ncbi:hypothetical protein TVAG_084720 [Trichomonas vaginalis G3]|uniref:Uncharacterized protein n=1 Tax=Trichomonas vaginalis (strain ATCC PRA-98 / G3) TaxID=412133 RepID=A2F3R3_TRIV3|nr:protein polyglycylation [Trichomonas vaginalis G3]EAY00435.1 hypothetical protein TVAG_084720 [Trichomonas vaginalis G3]KAI5493470.1 protein polyglycylation [Trichomonas vaginalis G3]|eukprot:XP_001313364.1 hypothetical protein [Trichomonas vaginalis G3]